MQIDFSQAISAQDRAAQAAEARATRIKAECGDRILAVSSIEAQINAMQASSIFSAAILGGADRADALASAGLMEGDLGLAEAWAAWVSAMRTECQRAIAEGGDPAWPDVPAGVPEFAERF